MNTLPWNPFFQATSIPSPARYFYLLPPLVARALYQCFMRQTPTMIYHTHTTTFHTTSGHCCLILLSVWPKSWLAVFHLPTYLCTGPVSATSHDPSHCFEPRPICNGPSPWFRCGAIRDTTRKWRYCQRTHTERSTLCLCPVFPLHLNFKLI